MANIKGSDIQKVVVACDAGMGSSVMLASQLRRQLKKHRVTVEHTPVNSIPADADFAGHHTSWLVPIVGLSLIAAVIAYSTGIGAARRLGARLAAFVGLAEVLFAVLFAWAFLHQTPTGLQLIGGALVLAGIALVRADDRADAPDDAPELVTAA